MPSFVEKWNFNPNAPRGGGVCFPAYRCVFLTVVVTSRRAPVCKEYDAIHGYSVLAFSLSLSLPQAKLRTCMPSKKTFGYHHNANRAMHRFLLGFADSNKKKVHPKPNTISHTLASSRWTCIIVRCVGLTWRWHMSVVRHFIDNGLRLEHDASWRDF